MNINTLFEYDAKHKSLLIDGVGLRTHPETGLAWKSKTQAKTWFEKQKKQLESKLPQVMTVLVKSAKQSNKKLPGQNNRYQLVAGATPVKLTMEVHDEQGLVKTFKQKLSLVVPGLYGSNPKVLELEFEAGKGELLLDFPESGVWELTAEQFNSQDNNQTFDFERMEFRVKV